MSPYRIAPSKCPEASRKAHAGSCWSSRLPMLLVRGRVRLVRTYVLRMMRRAQRARGNRAAQGLIHWTGLRPCGELFFRDEQPTEGMR
jgi:hypothetical protein